MSVSRAAYLSVVACVLSACAGSKSDIKTSGTGTSGPASAPAIRTEKKSDEDLVEQDLYHSGKTNLWVYTAKGNATRVLRKELDINGDGKPDVVQYYNAQGQLERVARDLDFDGKLDQMDYYENGVLVRKERYLDYSGRPNLWIYYENGQLVRKERDTGGHGRVDYWEYWRDGKIDRIGEDLDGDGTVDRWTKGADSDAPN